ncbi:MAG: sulfotransferase [Asticcacaulis sp.]
MRARFLTQRARALIPLGRHAEARDCVRAALVLGADDAQSLYLLGASLFNAMLHQEALPLLTRAAALEPRAGAHWTLLGDCQHYLGQDAEAEASYEKAVACDTNPLAHLALARLKKWTPAHNHVERLKALLASNPGDEARRNYALFKEFDDLGQRDEAWAALQAGAAAARAEPSTPRSPAWVAQDEADTVAAWRRHFPPERFASPAPQPRPGPRRIFVIGLPRSGTTLVERILGAHSQVAALGELQAFPAAAKIVSGAKGWALLDADTIAAIAQTDPAAFADFYDRETAYLFEGRSPAFVTDKLPHNSDYAGLIRLAFPDAAIVHVRRAPMDSLFGAYKLYFAARWSFAQDDLADHYYNYATLMRHWRDCLGAKNTQNPLIEVSLKRSSPIRKGRSAGCSTPAACRSRRPASARIRPGAPSPPPVRPRCASRSMPKASAPGKPMKPSWSRCGKGWRPKAIFRAG